MELYSAFVQSAHEHKDRTSLAWEGGSLTYDELRGCCNAMGRALLRLGGRRRNIALLAPNAPNFVFALFGILGAGHVAVPFSPLLKPEELAKLLAHSEAIELLYDPLLKEQAEAAIRMTGLEIQAIPIPDFLSNDTLERTDLSPAIDEDELSMILYTSGTTGNPKGVMLSHKNVHCNFVSFKEGLQYDLKHTFINTLPLHHTFAMTVNLFGSQLVGARLFLFSQFDPKKIVGFIMSEPHLVYCAVSPMLLMLARFAPDDAAERHNLDYAISGGGPLPDEVYRAFLKKYNCQILQGYGLTETSPVVAHNRPGMNKIGTIGPPLPRVEVQVRDDEGVLLGPNEIGELCVRGDLVMKGYFKNEETTRSAFYEEGWLRTGDMASIDEEGYVKIVGRLKDLIVCGGENIYPQEVEDTLLKHPAVHEVAVVAQPDRLRSEVPHAFVILNEADKEKCLESELRNYCREHLAEYKAPDYYTFVDEMPRTAKGTVAKNVLRQRLAVSSGE